MQAVTPIFKIQGEDLHSPLAGQQVRTQGVVTGVVRHGFFLQDPDANELIVGATHPPKESHAVFVYSPTRKPQIGLHLQLDAEVVDYVKGDNDKPVTQLHIVDGKPLAEQGPEIEAFELNAENLPSEPEALASFLNQLESMLVRIKSGAQFIQPSNPFGDYVVLPDGMNDVVNAPFGGVLLDPDWPKRWYPGFRITDYDNAPRLNVGSRLLSDIQGPLNFRASSYQITVNHEIDVQPVEVERQQTRLAPDSGQLTVLTLNGFNLDVQIEDPDRVVNPEQDIDDDVGDKRFIRLAQAIVWQAAQPDIVALQEIQDNDGAEQSDVVDASATYEQLIAAIAEISEAQYAWVDLPPEPNADGGQPGGNIRNGFLYNADRVEMVGNPYRLGETADVYQDSRKPLVVKFKLKGGSELAVINLHLTSKRHQYSIFAPDQPGFDPRLQARVEQALIVRDELLALTEQGIEYYVTGDFNDTEYSETLTAMLGQESTNLVMTLPKEERYDYNHRGVLQVLMHGVVRSEFAQAGKAEYEILHGNELIGITPGELGDKPSDHAYVIARLSL